MDDLSDHINQSDPTFGPRKVELMKIYIAYGSSRNFDFEAIGRTALEAEQALIETFEAHARQYELPLVWWKSIDFYVREREMGKGCRDGEPISAKWFQPEEGIVD